MDRWIIEAALVGLEAQKKQIDIQTTELRRMLGEASARRATNPVSTKGKRTISEAGKRAIAEAQRKRWAAREAEVSRGGVSEQATKPKRRLSKAGRAAIVAALKRRWAAKRAAA